MRAVVVSPGKYSLWDRLVMYLGVFNRHGTDLAVRFLHQVIKTHAVKDATVLGDSADTLLPSVASGRAVGMTRPSETTLGGGFRLLNPGLVTSIPTGWAVALCQRLNSEFCRYVRSKAALSGGAWLGASESLCVQLLSHRCYKNQCLL